MSGTIIEGLGEDLVLPFIGLVFIVALIFYVYRYLNSEISNSVHEESTVLASDVREQVLQNRNTTTELNDLAGSDSQPQNVSDSLTVDEQQVPEGISQSRLRATADVNCPICLEEIAFRVQTNCGHCFCGRCFMTWWHSGRWTGAAKCPVCRQQVHILLQCFTEEERRVNTDRKKAILDNIRTYNRRYSNEPLTWIEYVRDLPTMLRHCISSFFTLGGLMWVFRMRIFVCFCIAVLYLISPLDIIPEAVFGFFGLLDDIFIVFLLAIYVSIIYRRYIVANSYELHED